MVLPTDTAAALSLAVGRAVELLRAGEPVALPTETVYGLAADALSPSAAARIFEAKERPFFDPLICHLPDRGWLERMATLPANSRQTVEALVARFWPGPLTLVLPRRDPVPDLVTAGLGTVALRMTAHPVFQAVATAFAAPLAAPSANRFGRISPTAAAHVVAELGGRIPLVLNGGPARYGLESTIVAVEGDTLRILRPGPITTEQLAECGRVSFGNATGSLEAPGQMKSHYAPATRLWLQKRTAGLPAGSGARIGLLAWQDGSPDERFVCTEVLSPDGDLREAAATLFAKLRLLDELGLDGIVCEPVPEQGLGRAIMDRLRKGAAGRD